MSKRASELSQTIAARIERIATTAIRAIGETASKEDYVTDAKGLSEILAKQEGALPRRATLLGPESQERYAKK